jgi:FKBP-type peptidyl-prolyl cis-trans isomerase SlyD
VNIINPCVVALTWTLSDTLGEELDVLIDPIEFFIGGDDLLPIIEANLLEKTAGETINLSIEPIDAFGEFDAELLFLESKNIFPDGLEVGVLIEGSALPPSCNEQAYQQPVLIVSEIYPDHIVLDGNHPLSGIALRLLAQIHTVRPASEEEVKRRSCGKDFFRLDGVASDQSSD